ncbi:MAG TPA: 3-phosphoshikimate 1-carboxyvinyltransferase [Firmicutes bacterium]|nr:3-phosphoshikimate 1-carboxyvinyltransferase [Bacillota bacterium]
MDIRITPTKLSGTVKAIASKSDGHRILICAALADRPTTVLLDTWSKDMEATLNVVTAMGAKAHWVDTNHLRIDPIDEIPATATLDCGESGSTLRFLFPVAAALGSNGFTFTGRGKLPQRPMEPLRSEIVSHGALCKGAMLPMTISGQLHGGNYTLPGDISSQYVSGLLFALPLLLEDSVIHLASKPESEAYIAMTLSTLSQFGIKVEQKGNDYHILGRQQYRSPGTITVEGDWSNAAFWLGAGAISDTMTVTGLDFRSRQGDKAMVDLMEAMGAEVTKKGNSVTVSPGSLHGITIDAREIPDLVPILSVVATAAQGDTKITNAKRLRLKECDRLAAISQCLNALGGNVGELEDGLIIHGKTSLKGNTVSGFNDHRIVMSMAMAALICQSDITVEGAEAVDKSYPTFFEDYRQLGGKAHVL